MFQPPQSEDEARLLLKAIEPFIHTIHKRQDYANDVDALRAEADLRLAHRSRCYLEQGLREGWFRQDGASEENAAADNDGQ